MRDNVIPEDVRHFILENIDSVAQLEGLLLLRASPAVGYRANEIADRLYIPVLEADKLLSQLSERGILEKNETQKYFYRPGSMELENRVEKLAGVYARYLVPV